MIHTKVIEIDVIGPIRKGEDIVIVGIEGMTLSMEPLTITA